MDAQIVLADLPGAGPHQRLRVALDQGDDGRLTIELCEQHYAEGIGWFDQRSLSLEPGQFKRLQAVLGMKAASWDVQDRDEPPATLPFPGPNVSGPRRPALVERA
jgi:hypothetical protein